MFLVLMLVFALVSMVFSSFLIRAATGAPFIPFNYYFLWLIFGYKRVLLYDGQYSFNTTFKTVALFRDGEFVKAYRYPSCYVGDVKLKKDGTATYCGNYKWKFI
jgi:hypothetical protein